MKSFEEYLFCTPWAAGKRPSLLRRQRRQRAGSDRAVSGAASGPHFKTKTLAAVYTSPLPRCIQTAQVISAAKFPCGRAGASRDDTGLWEGLTFVEIKSRYPAEYAARGQHMGTVAPPGGESFRDAGRDWDVALCGCWTRPTAISPSSAMAAQAAPGCVALWASLLTIYYHTPALGRHYGPYSRPAGLTVRRLGLQPGGVPADIEIEAFLERMNTPAPIRAHGPRRGGKGAGAGRDEAAGGSGPFTCGLPAPRHGPAGRGRARRKSCKTAGRRRWTALADIVARHHDLGASPSMEAKLLYLADKLTLGESTVTLDARFAKSREKCKDTQALAAWKKRYDDTIEIFKELQRVTP